MEFILIDENKIKVMLSEEDLKEFEISTEELDYSNTDTKRMFWDILSRAKHLTGFDTDGQRILVQLYPSREGGCEMFVTKIGEGISPDMEENEGVEHTSKPKPRRRPTQKRSGANAYSAVFSFSSIFDMISVCRSLSSIEYSGKSAAYIDEGRRFYLFLADVDISGYIPADRYSFIFEFGVPESRESAYNYLLEHGKVICGENAVNILSRC